MDNLTMWTLIVGFLLPNVVALVEQPSWSKPARTAVSAVVSVLGGAGTAYFAGDFVAKDVITSILIVGVASITFYKGFWKPAGIAPVIEQKTSASNGESGETGIVTTLVVVLVVVAILVLIF